MRTAPHCFKAALLLSLLVGGVEADATAEDSASNLQQVITVNSFDQAGKTPFHIKIAFKVFSIDGSKLNDSGMLEEWWASPSGSLVTVTSLAANIANPIPFEVSALTDLRERYLLNKLLESELHPVPALHGSATGELKEVPKAFEKLKLNCLNFPPKTPVANRTLPLSFCVDPQTFALRIAYEGEDGSMTHNTLGNFHGTFVPVELEIAFFKQAAITGKVVALNVYDPLKSAVKLSSNSLAAANPQGGCNPSEALRKVNPAYPIAAKANHVSGTVLLHGWVSEQGTVKDVTTIASSSILLNSAAMDAYKQWTYEPCLLNGLPSEHETNVTLRFNFGGS